VRDGLLVFLLAERLVDGPPRHRLRDIADAAGVPLDLLVALRRANGCRCRPRRRRAHRPRRRGDAHRGRVPRGGRVRRADARRRARARPRDGAGGGEHAAIGLELALEPGTSEAELARRFAERSAALVPMLGPMLEQMLRLHLRHAVGTEALGADERAAGTLPAAREVAVAFADLVGFTRLGEEVPPAELGAIAERLAALAGDLAEPPVRLVKTIGDAAMLVSPDVDALLDVALRLHDAAAAEGDAFPQLRIGVAARPGVARAGDWYGRPVNLASRITAVARPGACSPRARCATPRATGTGGRRPDGGRCAASTGPWRSTARGAPTRTATTARRLALAARHAALEAQAVGVRAQIPWSGSMRAGARRGGIGAAARRAAGRGGRRGRRATRAPRPCPTALIAISVVCSPAAAAIGPGDRHPERHQAERDGEVVGAHARDRGGRHLLLDARVPEREEERRRDPAGNSSDAIPAVPRPLPMITACVAAPTSATAATSTGRRIGSRSARRLPAIVPSPKQATIVAQLDAPSRSLSASAGRGRTRPAARTRGRRPWRRGPTRATAPAHLAPAGAQPRREAVAPRRRRTAAARPGAGRSGRPRSART
jgi:adenylate cyclase